MSPRYAVVERKLVLLAGYVEELRPKARFGLNAYRRQGTLRRAVERLLQLCVEAASDACAGLLVAGGHAPAPNLRTQFRECAALGALPEDLAGRLADAAGLRNRLVHDYDRLDDGLVWSAARAALRDFPEFIASLTNYMCDRATDGDNGRGD